MADDEILEVAGRTVRITNPEKVFFPALGATKLDLVRYYLAVAPGVLTACRDRPTLLKRHPNGVEGDFFYQKRVPASRPEWIQTAHVTFPSGRTASFLSMHDEAHLAWTINLGCLELHPWPVRSSDVDHPDEMRIDLDPTEGVPFADVRRVALVAAEVLEDLGLRGFPRTSGKRGIHVMIRIEPRWDFKDVRRAALALGREVERRAPDLATTAWWKEERHGVFVDYNQNARDRTLASAYSVRPTEDARVAAPLAWDEVADVDPAAFTIRTVPERFATVGDPGAGIDDRSFSLDPLFELSERQASEGATDAPWPPQFPKEEGEPTRVAPSRARGVRKKAAPAKGRSR
ncbi:MAG TPA: non-homologous end-joining DNA ligase [Actinomycetota bacterium]|nr:non-homologous end-joining DNA ligase [Actinomycetota bacterium]